MKQTIKKISYALIAVLLCITIHCMNNPIKSTPIAKAGDDTITRGFLSYTAEKLGMKNVSKEKKIEIVNKIIDNVAIAHHARAIGLNTGKVFEKEKNSIIFQARIDYFCTQFNYKERCPEKLFARLADTIGFKKIEIQWEKVFTKNEADFIPYGGNIPLTAPSRKTSRESLITISYAETIQLVSRLESTTLFKLLLSLSDEAFHNLSTATNGECNLLFTNILLERYMPSLISSLPDESKALLAEIERRAEQNLLVGLYRQHIGFEQISGGKASSFRYEISDDEIRSFYKKNTAMFEEPLWVEISHIRLRDYDKAVELKKILDLDPEKFCDLAKKFSRASDAARCGYIGIVKREKKLPLFKEFAFTMNREGEISHPFLADGFTEIIKLHKRKTRILPLTDPHVKKLVADALQAIKREEKFQQTIREERKKIGVEIYTERI